MLNILFWNVQKKSLGSLVAAAASDNDTDVVILAECVDPESVYSEMNADTSRFFNRHDSLDGRFVVFSRLPREGLEEMGAYGGLTFFRLMPPIGEEYPTNYSTPPQQAMAVRTGSSVP